MKKSLLFYVFIFLLNFGHSQPKGIPPSAENCAQYQANSEWLPDAYIHNAECACLEIGDSETANIVRNTLKERVEATPIELKEKAKSAKRQFLNHEISKRKYKRFIIRNLTPVIYEDHIKSYQAAGCNGDPAPYWAWKLITTSKVKSCKMIGFLIRFGGGSCSKKWGHW
jgi:hypothetical protein